MNSKNYCPLIKGGCIGDHCIFFIGVIGTIPPGESSPIVSGACAIPNIHGSLLKILEILERLDRKRSLGLGKD